jgi:hypothetical protein
VTGKVRRFRRSEGPTKGIQEPGVEGRGSFKHHSRKLALVVFPIIPQTNANMVKNVKN